MHLLRNYLEYFYYVIAATFKILLKLFYYWVLYYIIITNITSIIKQTQVKNFSKCSFFIIFLPN